MKGVFAYMTRRQIDQSREIRLWIGQILIPAAGIALAFPGVREKAKEKILYTRDKVKDLEGRMKKVEARLSLGDKRFDLQSDDMGHLLNTQMALMIHFVSGNDHDKLREQIDSLSTYMAQRATKAAAYAAENNEIQNGGNNE